MTRTQLRRRLLRALASVLIVLALVADGTGPRAPRPGTPPYLTVFMLDGLSQEVFERELDAGRLPNIAELVRNGAWVKNGIASFPSMTAYGFYPFITAYDASKSGVLGLRFFDRRRSRGQLRSYVGSTHGIMNRDFAKSPETLYERFWEQHSASVNTYANRGVYRDVKVGWEFTMAKYRNRWWVPDLLAKIPLLGARLVPTWEGAERAVVDHALADLERRPKIQWITFTSLDANQHVYGSDERYAELVRVADAEIGRYRRKSAALGQEAFRIYAVVTDHGVANARHNLDLRRVLGERAGLSADRDEATHLFESELDESSARWDASDAVVVINGNMLNYLYFRDPSAPRDGFRRRLFVPELRDYKLRGDRRVDLIDVLRSEPGIELVIGAKHNGDVVLFGQRGSATISKVGDGLAYSVEVDDPLGYYHDEKARALIDGRGHSANDWLAATIGTRYPDAVHRVFALLGAENVGDLVVTSTGDWDLGDDYELFVHDYRGGHGGLRADQLRVPYVLSGPGVRPGARVAWARAEDVGATLFALLGLELPPGADGRVLGEALAR